ncbi:GAP family protein [Listeria ivanovii]|uniref:GAP family protein n=2 Tax=Listeria ivanovii TaxID=1638 RepID=A0ABS1G566_LISIV|nr:GAP family protein [Listeria ivanovii]EFR98240.1 membrane protein, putative [Listeria ivanovii FSL F6-596]AIS58769.1 membrane protein [Listeria ivanovii subsp. londoniensis]AIS61575.1 membrane protein [Listeria ivanovii subsp. londoniensis]MBK1962011.1 GAP family protein [Listeria ivanovii subsp. londoniensis]MBK1965998.1 GAP family protein [Listeria ivanovii subsp. londoniensis]
MDSAFSAILSPAVGILISPFPIVGLILILLSNKARINSIFYTIGWIIGNIAIFFIGLFLMSSAVNSSGDQSMLVKIVLIVLGGLLILLGAHDFMKRPKNGEKAATPKWFEKMSNIKPGGAMIFAFALSAINPKNMLLSLTAGVSVGALNLAGGQETATIIMFTLIACCSIYIPTIAFLVAGDKLNKVLDSARKWLIQNNSVIMAVLFLFIGLSVISKAF